MAEIESAHGKLSKVDQEWDANRFMMLLVATMVVALIVIYSIASYKFGDFSYNPLAHDPVEHSIPSSVLDRSIL